jgi:predicted pyridoxine 5'-phosphate oxidase superfamily flavin-nucleotide-binding protein
MQDLGDWGRETSPFHAGEQAIQNRLGRRERMEALGRRVIRPYLPDQHRSFLEQLPYVVVGSVDTTGSPWASLLVGEPGFLSSPDPQTIVAKSAALPGDPLEKNLHEGAALGLLGIELASRRRNRANVRVAGSRPGELILSVDQSFGNCPQYIQSRPVQFHRVARAPSSARLPETLSSLSHEATRTIRAADTFFVSSFVEAEEQTGAEGVDVSHRGGRPGFVKVEGDTLTIPDFSGNSHFNTLGNFLLNPKAGLSFVDFETGDVLMLSGSVEILWEESPEVRAFRH